MTTPLLATPAATAALSRDEARRLTARIRDALVVADGLLVQAWAGQAWAALGYASWADYCAAELPGLRMLRLDKAERDARLAAAGAEGLTVRAIADAYGVGTGTVHRALEGVARPDRVTGTDGRTRAARTEGAGDVVPAGETRADQVVRLVLAAGTKGLTSPELARRAKISQGAASGALSRLHRGPARVIPSGQLRAGYAAYIAGAGR